MGERKKTEQDLLDPPQSSPTYDYVLLGNKVQVLDECFVKLWDVFNVLEERRGKEIERYIQVV